MKIHGFILSIFILKQITICKCKHLGVKCSYGSFFPKV